MGKRDKQEAALVLDMVQHGIRLQWCNPSHEQKQKEPRHEKLKGVKVQLRKAGYGQQDTQDKLTAETMVPLVFPNLLERPEDQRFAAT